MGYRHTRTIPRPVPDAAPNRMADAARVLASELAGLRAAVDAGELPDAQLVRVLSWIEHCRWDNSVWSTPLTVSERDELRSLVARAVHRQHGGRFESGLVAIVSDGATFRTMMR